MRKNMRLDFINTGGTINSKHQHGAMTAVNTASDHTAEQTPSLAGLLEQLAEQYQTQIQLHTPFQKNSEDIQATDWLALLNSLWRANHSDSDAILVSHGTDSMAYSLALCACLDPVWRKPLCFSGAFISPELPHSDAYANLDIAFDYLQASHKQAQHHTQLAFQVSSDKAAILPGAWVLPMRAWGRYFETAYQHITAYKASTQALTWAKPLNQPQHKPQKDIQPSLASPSWAIDELPQIEQWHQAHQDIAYISYIPGMDIQALLQAYRHHRVVIIELLHSGTGSFSGDNSLLSLIEQCSGQIILSALPSLYIAKPYESSLALKQSGAWLLRDLPSHFVYCFCLLGLAIHPGEQALKPLADKLKAWRF